MMGSDIEGSGIGLSIVQEITMLHKWDIKAFVEDQNNQEYFIIKIII